MEILRLYYSEEDLVVTPTRHQKDILQVAENITVITSEEIEMINAHTLTDALNNIPGVQMDIKGGPGSVSSAYIQGFDLPHVLVMIDGIAINNLSDNAVDIGAIPIQNIDRIEIIKGPASSSWGSSLGGIINIITKLPRDSKKITGTYSASYGEKNSTDHRAEASGKAGNLAYYFYTGNLSSDGLTESTPYNEDNFYSKLIWNLENRGRLLFTLGYNKGSRGNFKSIIDPSIGLTSNHDNFKYLFSTLTLEHQINNEAKFKLSFRSSSQDKETYYYDMENGAKVLDIPWLPTIITEDSLYGGSIDLTWKHGINNILFGLDFDRGKLKSKNVVGGEQYIEKWGIYSNDTIKINNVSLTPGLRYDHTNTNGDNISPSLGLTYMITERNLFRGYVAKGFHIPPLSYTFAKADNRDPNPGLKVEKIWSIQAGIESTELKYLWLKTTLFRHYISDGIEIEENKGTGIYKAVNKRKQRRQGIELEIKTVSVYNTSLFTGFSFIDAQKISTDFFIPRYTFDIGINYYNNKSFWACIKGHYISWDYNEENEDMHQDYIFIWDVNLIKEIHWHKEINVRTFLTVHNVFNGSPYHTNLFGNLLFDYPGRWIETGIKFNF